MALEKSRFWHALWIDVGKPKTGEVARAMRASRLKYHYAVRFLKKNESDIRNCKMAEALANTDKRDFYREIKTMLGCKKKLPVAIDGATDNNDIANIFGDEYKSLYNSVGYSRIDMDKLLFNINKLPTDRPCDKFTIEEVRDAIKALKPGKSDGDVGLTSDHIINGGDKLCCYLTFLYNTILKHAHVPTCMLLSTIIPIPKNGADSSFSSNYRGIALASCLGKILDRLIMNKYQSNLLTSDLQFGFKKGGSTDSCTFVFKETVNYYVNDNSNVYGVLLDATKAFDRVNFCKMFQKLINRKMPKQVLLMLLHLYTNQQIRVAWNGCYSEKFSVTNGVRQGACSSPTLYSVYIDDLLKILEASKVGCYIGKMFVGALAYADDLTLLAPSIPACRKLLSICEDYAQTHGIKFNPSKSQLIVFGSGPRPMANLCLSGQIIPEVQKVQHLGHAINNKLNDVDDVIAKRAAFVGQVNFIINTFKQLKSKILYNIFNIYCMSFFGSQLWKLNAELLGPLNTSYNIALRKILQLPHNSHRAILYSMAAGRSLTEIICDRTWSFIQKCRQSCNTVVKNVTVYIDSVKSSYMHNFVMLKYYPEMVQCNLTPVSEYTMNFCYELLDCRDGCSVNGLSSAENRALLNFISTT